jgi:hypothetical protein
LYSVTKNVVSNNNNNNDGPYTSMTHNTETINAYKMIVENFKI